MPESVIILDFQNKQVVQVVPGNEEHEQTLAEALTVQRRQVATASGSAPPPPDPDSR